MNLFKVLNHVGSSQIKMIVLLNDNEISICKNISGINIFLIKLRTRKKYIMEKELYLKNQLQEIVLFN